MQNKLVVALAGNPNAGKTTIFNALTGARQHVGNWPGVTVEKKERSLKHKGREVHVVDLPGTYSLTAFSLEEIIARNFIVDEGPDIVINVVDASNLERNLYLTVQLLEMGCKVVIALNMIDVASSSGIDINTEELAELFGAPVIETNGKRGVGLDKLLDTAISEATDPETQKDVLSLNYGLEIEEELEKLEIELDKANVRDAFLSNRWLSIKLLEADAEISKKIHSYPMHSGIFNQVDKSRKHLTEIFGDNPEILLADSRYGFISGAVKVSVKVERRDRVDVSQQIDKVLTDRFLGPIILLAVLYTVYMVTFQGSEPLVTYFELFFKWLSGTVSELLPDGLLKSLIVSGIIDGVGGVLGFTPLIAFMFLTIAILEDTGYMARIAFMLDRVLKGFGLHGASMLALMVSGGIAGGCAVPGIMATRTMKEPKERLVTILVAPLMNCGAKLPVYALLIGAFFSGSKASIMFLLTIISWGLALIAGKIIRSTVLKGPSAPFVLELPPYRIPTFRGLLIHTWERTWMYVRKAGTSILAVSVVLWAMMTFPDLPEERQKEFDDQLSQITQTFLLDPGIKEFFTSSKDIEVFQNFHKQFEGKNRKDLEKQNPHLASLAVALEELATTGRSKSEVGSSALMTANAYLKYQKSLLTVEGAKQREKLRYTLGGRLGTTLEYVTRPLGFDWRTNVALVGGFAAKEVVVSTLGTAYSLGEVDPGLTGDLSEQLRNEPGWNPLLAFTLIMFVMLYAPCFVTLVVIRRETGKWRWTFFAMIYTTTLAYCVALVVRSVGLFFGIGVS